MAVHRGCRWIALCRIIREGELLLAVSPSRRGQSGAGTALARDAGRRAAPDRVRREYGTKQRRQIRGGAAGSHFFMSSPLTPLCPRRGATNAGTWKNSKGAASPSRGQMFLRSPILRVHRLAAAALPAYTARAGVEEKLRWRAAA